jgi:hypothetical protein
MRTQRFRPPASTAAAANAATAASDATLHKGQSASFDDDDDDDGDGDDDDDDGFAADSKSYVGRSSSVGASRKRRA